MNDYDKIWYEKLNKSKFNPPSYIFGIVWPILYLLMMISVYRILINIKCYPFCKAIIFFSIQLYLNLFWTSFFFKKKDIELALYTLIYIIIFTLMTLQQFFNIDIISGYLLIPYLIWLLFALYLNSFILKNN